MLCLSGNVFIFLLFLNVRFVGCGILYWHFFSLLHCENFLHYLLTCKFFVRSLLWSNWNNIRRYFFSVVALIILFAFNLSELIYDVCMLGLVELKNTTGDPWPFCTWIFVYLLMFGTFSVIKSVNKFLQSVLCFSDKITIFFYF